MEDINVIYLFFQALLLIDTDLNVNVFPSSGESVVLQNKDNLFIHLAISETANFKGYSLRMSTSGVSLTF